MKYFLKISALLAVMIMAGCVSSGTHKKAVADLQAQLNDERAAHEDSEKRAVALEQKLFSTAKDRGQLQSTLDEMKKAMSEMKERQAEEQKRLKEFQDLTRRFKKLTDSGTLSVKIVDGKMVVNLGSDVLFSPGSAKLSSEGMSAIKEVSIQLASIPSKRFQIEGHTDNIPISSATFPSNWELASARALTVVKGMIDSAMPPERVSAASYADTVPAQSNATPEGRAANRRITIVVVPDLSTLPGYDELQKYAQ